MTNLSTGLSLGLSEHQRLAPSDIAGLVVQCDAGIGVHLVSGKVDAWTDQSGMGHTPAQATSANRPTVATADVNGRDAISFDGISQFLQSVFTLTQPVTAIAVMNIVTSGVGVVHDVAYDGGDSAGMAVSTDNISHYYIYAGNVLSVGAGGDPPTGVYFCAAHVFDGSNGKIRFNGVQKASGDCGTNAPNGLTIGALASGSRACKIKVAEFLLYDTALSTTDLGKIERYLSAKYALGF